MNIVISVSESVVTQLILCESRVSHRSGGQAVGSGDIWFVESDNTGSEK